MMKASQSQPFLPVLSTRRWDASWQATGKKAGCPSYLDPPISACCREEAPVFTVPEDLAFSSAKP